MQILVIYMSTMRSRGEIGALKHVLLSYCCRIDNNVWSNMPRMLFISSQCKSTLIRATLGSYTSLHTFQTPYHVWEVRSVKTGDGITRKEDLWERRISKKNWEDWDKDLECHFSFVSFYQCWSGYPPKMSVKGLDQKPPLNIPCNKLSHSDFVQKI